MFDVATKLKKSFPYMRLKLTIFRSECNLEGKVLHLLDTVTISPDANGVPRVDALDFVSVLFRGIRIVQNALEVSDHITIIKVIPMLEDFKLQAL